MTIPNWTDEGAKLIDLVDESGTARGIAFWQRMSTDPVTTGPGACFVIGYGLGELAMLHRVRQVLDDPRSRGREIAILRSLAFVTDDEAANKRDKLGSQNGR